MKDPAFVFYSSDFLTGVMDLTMEERGQYITLLCLQHQKGHLSEKTIGLILGQVSDDVLSNFMKDELGNFYNERLEKEIEKRGKFLEHQRENGKKGGRPKKPKENPNETQEESQSESQKKPLEDENDNDNEIKDINEIDIENIFNQYNLICTNLSQVSDLTDTRIKLVKELLEKKNKDKILEVFNKANKCDWLIGKNKEGWKANFDWVIDLDNFVKIEERTL